MIDIVGWIAVILAIIMFFTFVDQIRLNLNGQPGSWVVPIGMILNCSAWCTYAMLLPIRDWYIFSPNFLGIIISIVNVVTVFWGRENTSLCKKISF